MRKQALRKDFFVEIKKSLGRFLSILLIVALGVSLFVGIRATEPDMLMSGDYYADQSRLMDIKVVSTFGLTEEDLQEVKGLSEIEEAEGSYSVDVLCGVGDNMEVLHVMSQLETMNQITVTEGRLPENTKECLVDNAFLESSGYQIGDTISIESGTEDDLEDTLNNAQYKIVGAGNSAQYFSLNRGSSLVGNGNVSGFMVVIPDCFELDVYTEIYAAVAGDYEEVAFTEEYETLVEHAVEALEAIQDERCEIRRAELVEEIQIEIDDAKQELNEKVAEAEEEIQDGESEIKDHEKEIADAKLEIADGKAQIADGKAQIADGKAQIADGKAQIADGKKQVESGKEEIASGKAQIETGREELEAGKAELEANKKSLAEQKAPLVSGLEALSAQKTLLEENLSAQRENEKYVQGEELLALQAAIVEMEQNLAGIDAQIAELNQALETQIVPAETQLAAAEAELLTGEQELLANEQELLANENLLITQEKELLAQEEELLKQEEELLQKEKELQENEAKLAEAEQELAEGEQELKDGKQELEDAKAELADKVQDAEEEIRDAEDEIAKLELPEWYVFDRDTLPEYSGYGDNAARIAALSVVFPSLFFFVAALISLTTMTRMVEEQRVQIGTLKALGYSKFDIMKKYLYYALTATLGGSVLGVLIGEKIFPYVIIAAYHITVYPNIVEVFTPYRWGIGAMATLIAVLCTGVATVSACYKELKAQPAILMRPDAPKVGKKTVIEKIPFLWKHLNFSWKSSLRNLFRYKKRFFMTLFGIGGCMGLLMVGFGLQDSIASISKYQFGELQLYDNSVFIDEDMEAEEKEKLDAYLTDHEALSHFMDVRMETVTTQMDKEEVDAYLTVIGDQEQIDDFFLYRDRKSKEVYTLGDEGVIISEKTATMLGAKVGDTIRLTEDGKYPKEVVIAQICENYFGHYVYMTDDLYQTVYGKEVDYNTVLVKAAEGVTQEELEKIGEDILNFDDILNVQYTENTVETLDGMLIALDRIIIVLILVAGLLSFVVLYNLNNINITERRRELATLKVLGFFPMEVGMYVYRENMLLTLLGVAVGCVMGKYLHLFTIKTVEVDQAMFGRVISLESYVTCALFTILFSIIVNWIMYFKLKKINMVESLKSVE